MSNVPLSAIGNPNAPWLDREPTEQLCNFTATIHVTRNVHTDNLDESEEEEMDRIHAALEALGYSVTITASNIDPQ